MANTSRPPKRRPKPKKKAPTSILPPEIQHIIIGMVLEDVFAKESPYYDRYVKKLARVSPKYVPVIREIVQVHRQKADVAHVTADNVVNQQPPSYAPNLFDMPESPMTPGYTWRCVLYEGADGADREIGYRIHVSPQYLSVRWTRDGTVVDMKEARRTGRWLNVVEHGWQNLCEVELAYIGGAGGPP